MPYFENFISYRHSSTMREAKRLRDRLVSLGHSVFWDSESLHTGRFDKAIVDAIANCRNFIVLTRYDALLPCSDQEDWVRREICEALRCGRNIILLFVGEPIRFPPSIPSDMSDIKRYNGISFFDPDSNQDMDRLVSDFLGYDHSLSQPDDFIIKDGELVAYRGTAPIVEIPEQVTRIGRGAFTDRTDIQEVHLASHVVSIGALAFERCREVKTIEMPASLERIEEGAFRRCVALKSVIFNESLQTIGPRAFEFCSALSAVSIGGGLKDLSPSAFNNCPSLTSIAVSDANSTFCSVDGSLYTKDLTTLVRCPEGKRLLDLPLSVSSFGDYSMFKSCVRTLAVPGEVSSIGGSAFQQSKIQTIAYEGDPPTIAPYAFAECTGLSNNPFVPWEPSAQSDRPKRNVKAGLLTYEYVTVTTTFESLEDAHSMVSMLLEKKLIVAGQIRHIRSVYWWNGDVCDEPEIELACITEGTLYDRVEDFIVRNHPYEVPQVICTPIINVTTDYGNWISDYVEKRSD